ncbi:MAG: hypothetical protein COV74_05255 [Candidatus Omnitrophica bacterium CG11_big_fil_rev_8_21_14_0_20_45_26]|uniref:ATPase domain-containing protein n=1 Tax=Candidatus Abzuiibacterium crystallinum TaxID=1974748 RepID=A0A2H0LPB6_9BACT|nr:MAG: hypothetical protein COV74_05255 [Candidatus Omnitrophica bacterium CG11_big_fil_rev_8_21_14_0_20_45_26]PIW64298.1 MAG: hypothetical protein COW12_06575 [Candidatus Omnitrophica bacterium CG12_big_fil_rev_8_21_14_0_65_45_16]
MMAPDPITDTSFFGREEILGLLRKRTEAFRKGYRQNIGLIGEPFIGKTSVLIHFLRHFPHDDIIPILIKVNEAESFQVFLQKWLGAILYGYQQFLGMPVVNDYQMLVKQMRRLSPRVVKQMRYARRLAEGQQYDESYRELLNLLQVLKQETNRQILLIIEEFDRLVHLPLSDPFAQMGKEVMVQKDTMYVVTSSKPTFAREIFRDKLSFLFSNFEIVDLRIMPQEEAEAWMARQFACLEHDALVRKVVYLITHGHPYYMRTLLTCIGELLASRQLSDISESILIEALTKEFFDQSGVIHQHFMMKIFSVTRNRFGLLYGDVLLAIALAKKKMAQIAHYLGKPHGEIKKILQRLILEGFIVKRGSFLDFTDMTLRFWMSEVYFRKRASLSLDYEDERNQFRSSLKQFIQTVSDEMRRDLPLRIEALFRQFKNEVVDLGRHRIKCPRFQVITTKPSNGRMFPVLAESHSTRWLCQVVKEQMDEDDVRAFVNDVKRLRKPLQKKILISLKGTDLNAKILAQEAKIQIWDIGELNLMMDLYGKQKVVF